MHERYKVVVLFSYHTSTVRITQPKVNDSLLSLWGMTQKLMESNVKKLYMFVETHLPPVHLVLPFRPDYLQGDLWVLQCLHLIRSYTDSSVITGVIIPLHTPWVLHPTIVVVVPAHHSEKANFMSRLARSTAPWDSGCLCLPLTWVVKRRWFKNSKPLSEWRMCGGPKSQKMSSSFT